jgi:hypothetical protein
LPALVTELGEKLVGSGVQLLRPLPVSPQVIHAPEVDEGGGLSEPVLDAFGSGQRGVVDAQGLLVDAADP